MANQSNNTTNQLDVTPIYPEIREVSVNENANDTHHDIKQEESSDGPIEETVKIKVVKQGTDPLIFVMKMSSQMEKLMQVYCKEANMGFPGLRFLYDGRRIQNHDTPKSLEIENNDIVEVLQLQQGGGNMFKY